jgi:hypothetical protein
VAAAADHTATIDVTPDIDGPNTLYVWTMDPAGILGDIGHPLL